jgi:hypothetical protein
VAPGLAGDVALEDADDLSFGEALIDAALHEPVRSPWLGPADRRDLHRPGVTIRDRRQRHRCAAQVLQAWNARSPAAGAGSPLPPHARPEGSVPTGATSCSASDNAGHAG